MKPLRFIILSIGLLAFTYLPDKKNIRIFMAGDSTMSIKESKAFPETGWGIPFVYFWDSSVTIINRAKNGRSTKTFIQEGLWKSITDELRESDYVFIQFGHNDESIEKKDRYTPPDSFKMNLHKFIRESREKGATPILLSPVSRRKFDKEGNAVATHEQYTALVKEVVKETGVLFIDLDEKSRALYQQWGPENSKLLFLQLQPDEHPNYPDGKIDNTHFNELGARLIAQLVLKELKKMDMALIQRLHKPPVKK